MIIRFLARDRKEYTERQAGGKLVLAHRCPVCGGRLHRHGEYLRGVDELEGQTWWLWIQRVRCHQCGVTHAILPHFLAPYQRMSTPAREAVARAWLAGRACSACRSEPAAACAP